MLAVPLQAALARLLPDAATVRAGPFTRFRGALLAGESGAVAGAVPGRRDEFRAGRNCARQALAAAGVAPAGIRVGPGRQPVWPPGIVGSIAHSVGLCAAAVADAGRIPHLGIDFERIDAVDRALAAHILTDREERHLAQGLADPAHALSVGFSVKESIFKAVYPAIGIYFDFLDVEIAPTGGPATFRARVVGDFPGAALITSLSLRAAITDGLVLSTATALQRRREETAIV